MDIELYKKLKEIGTELNPKMIQSTMELLSPLALKISADVSVARDLRYGTHERHRLDIFSKAQDTSTPKPVFIYVHGGGFVAGDKGNDSTVFYNNVGTWAVSQGWIGITLNYRLAPEHKWPSVVEDLDLALDWIVANAETYNIDSSKIILCGQSAGAVHAASYLVGPKAKSRICAAVLVSGIFDLVNDQTSPMEESYFGVDPVIYKAASTVEVLVQSDIPCLYAVSELDPKKFQFQSFAIVKNSFEKLEKLPNMIYLSGHNHLSPMLLIGTQNDDLGTHITSFAERSWTS